MKGDYFPASLAENRLQIFLCCGNRRDIEVFHQEVEHVGCDKGRQRRSQPDVLDAQVQQRQQDGHRLLLVPGEDQRQRQVVDAAVEGAGQGDGNLDRRVGVVALADVQQARDAADVAEVELVEAVLAAGQGEDDAILGNLLGELGVVVAAGFGAVAAADEEEVLDLAGLDRGDDLVGHAQHGIVAETGQEFPARGFPAEQGHSSALLMTAVKSQPSICFTSGHCTSPQV